MARIAAPALEQLDLNLLLALHWLLEEGGVGRAAKRLGLSQPATSHALGRLRELLGDPLLVTVGRAMVLTPRAQALRPALADAIARLRASIRAPDEFAPARATGAFRVVCSDYLGTVVAATWIARVAPEAPGLDLVLRPLEPEAVGGFASGEQDLVVMPSAALANVPRNVDADGFVRRAVFEERFVCVVRRGHPLAGQALSAARFAQLSHVLVSPQGRGAGVVDALLAGAGHARRVAYRVPAFLMALPIVAATDCVATVPAGLLAHAGADLARVEPPWAIPAFDVMMGWHPSRGNDPGHRWVRERLDAGLREAGAAGERAGGRGGRAGGGRPAGAGRKAPGAERGQGQGVGGRRSGSSART